MEQIYTAAGKEWKSEWRDLVRHRFLVGSLWLREIRIKYAQTLFGPLWAVAPPLAYVAVYTLFFSLFLRVDSGDVPYPLFALGGIIAWNFFRDIVMSAGGSLIAEANFIKKNYLPRLIVPLYKSGLGLVELAASLLLLVSLALILRTPLSWQLLFLPLIILLNWLVGFGLALWVCLLSIRVRDSLFLTASLLNLSIWFTPVFFGSELVPAAWRFLLYLNPMAGVIALYRWALFATPFPEPAYAVGLVSALLFALAGLRRFHRQQALVADYL